MEFEKKTEEFKLELSKAVKDMSGTEYLIARYLLMIGDRLDSFLEWYEGEAKKKGMEKEVDIDLFR